MLVEQTSVFKAQETISLNDRNLLNKQLLQRRIMYRLSQFFLFL